MYVFCVYVVVKNPPPPLPTEKFVDSRTFLNHEFRACSQQISLHLSKLEFIGRQGGFRRFGSPANATKGLRSSSLLENNG